MTDFRPRSFAELGTVWPPELDHVSASSLTMFARCPEQWRQRYCLGKRSAPSAAAIVGKADHQALAFNFEQKIETREDLPAAEVAELFAHTYEGELDMYGGATEVEWGRTRLTGADAKKAAAKTKDQGIELVALYTLTVAPTVQPTDVEVFFQVETEGVPVRIDGYIDVETETTLIERKTAQRTLSKPNPDWIVQGRIYQAVKKKPLVWHQSVRKAAPECMTDVEVPTMRLELDEQRNAQTTTLIQQTIRTIGYFHSLYGPDQIWPGALTHPWACGYCAYKPGCEWWQ